MNIKTMIEMDKEQIGELITFSRLLDEAKGIVIPKVQRDYVYGRREDEKVRQIRNDMLDKILGAAVDGRTEILDFVYGASQVKENKVSAGFIPLDGQQRLTTLFLLLFYASLIAEVPEDQIRKLLGFRYETRQSATQFTIVLLESLRPKLIKSYCPGLNRVKDLIINEPEFVNSFGEDPTVVSMLNVLEVIEEKCLALGAQNLNPSLWTRLHDSDSVMFYRLSLEEFGLTDDLFIKMNARGKKLTPFEIAKSEIMAVIRERIGRERSDMFAVKMDTQWIDMVWDHTDKSPDRRASDITAEADRKMQQLFANVCSLLGYLNGIPEPSIDTIFGNDDIESQFVDILDIMYQVHKSAGGFDAQWGRYFYFSDHHVGMDGKIRLFWHNVSSRRPVFELALNGPLSVPERVYFYAMYLLTKAKYDEKSTMRCLRIIHNLMTANVEGKDARTEKMAGFLENSRYVIEHKGVDVTSEDGKDLRIQFSLQQWDEEYRKLNCLSEADYESLMRYENHDILRCSLKLFMDHTGIPDTPEENPANASRLLGLLDKFERTYHDGYSINTVKAQILDRDIDYMQWEKWMDDRESSRDVRFRETIDYSGRLRDFYVYDKNRRNQSAVLQILEATPGARNTDFKITDWQYYLAKYPDKYKSDTKYGYLIWENRKSHPLDMIILNSSIHYRENLEWKVLTQMLEYTLAEWDKYHIDPHGCSHMEIRGLPGFFIGFEKGRWSVETTLPLKAELESVRPDLSVTQTDDRQLEIDFTDPSTSNQDYIELGHDIVKAVEKLAGEGHESEKAES